MAHEDDEDSPARLAERLALDGVAALNADIDVVNEHAQELLDFLTKLYSRPRTALAAVVAVRLELEGMFDEHLRTPGSGKVIADMLDQLLRDSKCLIQRDDKGRPA